MSNYDIKCKVIEEELRLVWPEWHVAGHLGGGAFGDVFQIYKENYGIRMDSALKVIQVSSRMSTVALPFERPSEKSVDTDSYDDIPDSLRSEIQIMEALRGAPNVVSIEDFYFRKEGTTSYLFVRMELLTSLEEVLVGMDGQRLLSSIPEIHKLGRDICNALMYCEKQGIIHRDIKPANLFVDSFGNYKVGDFGVSKRMDTVHAAHTMTSIGTISYMAPEIFRGKPYNNTVDIYALGLVLYQLLNYGRMPFLPQEGSYTPQDIDSANYMRLHGTPLPGLEGKAIGGERIDSHLDAVVRKACAVDPCDRYQTAKEFYDALILTETETKNEVKSGTKQKRTPTSEMPSKSGEMLTATEAKSGAESEKKKLNIPPVEKPSERHQNENKHPVGKKLLTAVVPLLVLVVAGLAVLLGRNRFSPSVNTSTTAQAEDEKEDDSATVTVSAKDASVIIEIPDPVLKSAIQDALEIGDREITRADALSLTYLSYTSSINNPQIKDITGLSEFKNLTVLDLSGNQISDIIALSGMTNLIELYLDDNQIMDISVLSGLTNLSYLSLYGNRVKDIGTLYSLTNLTGLILGGNHISDISPLSGLTSLTVLNLNRNQISDITTLSDLSNLTELNLSSNHLDDISALSNLTNLTYLRLSNDQISDISALSGLTNLTFLDLSYNQINDISALSGLTNLTWLDLSYTQISDISALSGMTNAEKMFLGHNQISDISPLSGLINLTYLDLECNQVNDVSALSDLTNLKILVIHLNPILKNKSPKEIKEVLSGADNLMINGFSE